MCCCTYQVINPKITTAVVVDHSVQSAFIKIFEFPSCSVLMRLPHLVGVTSVSVSGYTQMELDHACQWALKPN